MIDLPFMATDPRAWLDGILVPLMAHAVPHGQGLVGISYYLLDGSAQLSFYSYAALAFAVGLLGITVLFMRRLGPAIFILPWTVFFLATRSQDGYYLLMTPLWLASLATVPQDEFATAWQPRIGWLGRAPIRALLVALLLMPTAACLLIAITSAPPLQMQVLATRADDEQPGVAEIDVRVRNEGTSALRPHFAVSDNHSMSPYWRMIDGPETLEPGQTAEYRLASTYGGAFPGPHGYFKLRAVTDDPMTISSTTLPKTPSNAPAAPSISPAP